MIALHAQWVPARKLFLWAEDAVAMASPSKSQPRRKGKSGGVPRHPFSVSSDDLIVTLGMQALGDPAEVELLLPGASSRPFASPSAKHIGDEPRITAKPSLRPWRVPGLSYDARAALEVASFLATLLDPHIALDDTVRFFAQEVDVALDLVGRGRVLPGIVQLDDGAPEARWIPMPAVTDMVRAVKLAEAMPPLYRACAGEAGNPAAIVADTLAALVDGAARLACGNLSLRRSSRRLPKQDKSFADRQLIEAWVAGLSGNNPTINIESAGSAKASKQGRIAKGKKAVKSSEVGKVGGASEAADIAKIAGMIHEWHLRGRAGAAMLRTCFRLVEPVDDPEVSDPPWKVEFLLQPGSDPSALVPAGEVWNAGPAAKAIEAIDYGGENTVLQLLTGLGRASRLLPMLESALQVAHPEQLELDTAGALAFLSEYAPVLEQAGFGVFVPQWWRTRSARIGVRMRAYPRDFDGDGGSSTSLVGLDGLCSYDYEVALGDETLSIDELRALAETKMSLVQVRGKWVEISHDDLKLAIHALEDRSRGIEPFQMALGDLIRAGLGLEDSKVGLPVVDIVATGWLGNLLGASDAGEGCHFESRDTPGGFAGSLRPYQERGLGWLWYLDRLGLGACLADDMGLGKTAQLLALLLAEREDGSEPECFHPTLLVCPMSVVGNWQREAARFAQSLAVHVHHGGKRETGKSFARVAKKADLVVTSYSLVARDSELLKGIKWRRVVLDEAQNIKNPGTKQAQAVRMLDTPRRVALTGTPVENRLRELWSIMTFLAPGLLGSEEAFRKQFAVKIERYHDNEAAMKLKKITGPFILRRLKTDKSIITDLPEKNEMKVYCNLTKEQATLYQATVYDMLRRLETAIGMQRKGVILSSIMKLKQVCNHPAHFLADGSRLADRSGKLARLEEIVEEAVSEGDRMLCFTQFSEMGHLLVQHLEERLGCRIPFLHGGKSKRDRDAMVEEFQSGTGSPVFILSLKAGGVGLNLTEANHVIHYDRWWNPAVEDQATDRTFRIGQRKDVQVRKFICVGTLEEKIDQMIDQKRELSELIIGSGEAWLTELSTDQIRDMVALSADAVAEA
ncbi:MAG: DEAD/DEAH box helicase [Actinobacteria bacterium]|nr:DEAD/DEAH box helicase [Actinomycetota bacterium]MCL6105508.1 DEAD/DEAH box helicase [Actinomycetota bacterium]